MGNVSTTVSPVFSHLRSLTCVPSLFLSPSSYLHHLHLSLCFLFILPRISAFHYSLVPSLSSHLPLPPLTLSFFTPSLSSFYPSSLCFSVSSPRPLPCLFFSLSPFSSFFFLCFSLYLLCPDAVLTFKCLNGTTPESLCQQFVRKAHISGRCTRNSNSLDISFFQEYYWSTDFPLPRCFLMERTSREYKM